MQPLFFLFPDSPDKDFLLLTCPPPGFFSKKPLFLYKNESGTSSKASKNWLLYPKLLKKERKDLYPVKGSF
jgi:hypothetical protein